MYKYEIDLLNIGIWSPQTSKIYSFFMREIKNLEGIYFEYDINSVINKGIILSNNMNNDDYIILLEKINTNGLFKYIKIFEVKNNSGDVFVFCIDKVYEYGLNYNNLIQNKYKNIKNSCLIAGCKLPSQKCHTISRVYLENISVKGNVFGYDQNPRIFSGKIIKQIRLKKIGLMEASTKNIYCNKHDKIYNIFENQDDINSVLNEAILLLHHRVINAVKYDILQKTSIVNEINRNTRYINNDVSKNYDEYKNFEKKLSNNIPSQVISLVIKFDKMNISFTGLYFDIHLDYLYEFLKKGEILKINKKENPFFIVNCFSDKNKSYLILSSTYINEFKKNFKNIINLFELEDKSFIEYFILFLAISGGNFYFNPLWVENNKFQDIIDGLLNYLTFGIVRNKDITDFINFDLIKEKESLNLINFDKKEYEIKVISKNILENHIKNNIGHN